MWPRNWASETVWPPSARVNWGAGEPMRAGWSPRSQAVNESAQSARRRTADRRVGLALRTQGPCFL